MRIWNVADEASGRGSPCYYTDADRSGIGAEGVTTKSRVPFSTAFGPMIVSSGTLVVDASNAPDRVGVFIRWSR